MIDRRWLGFGIVLLLAGSACSADRKANPEYGPGQDCGRLAEYMGFCIKRPSASPEKDASEPDAATPDAGPDSGVDAGFDAGPPESCPEIGMTDFCYPVADALKNTATQEPCKVGTWTCQEDGLWSRCMGWRGPKDEDCDGIDNDCDGETDEDQRQRVCTVNDVMGACAEDGIGVCNDGQKECFQTVDPLPETCNTVDDDCDGNTDEGLEIDCYPDDALGCTANDTGGFDCVPASTCAPGQLRCVDGEMTECLGATEPGAEAGTTLGDTPLDEDCDGTIDEGFPCQSGATFACYTGPMSTRGRSPCEDGTQVCNGTSFGECMDETTPEPETCANQGVDNDCDGETDNIPRRGTSCSDTSSSLGLCKQNATWQCVAGIETCVDGTIATEVCNGQNQDENCDGQVDENFDLQSDENNCGSCGHRCGAGQTCCGGACVSTVTSNAHCGGCMNACTTGWTCCSSVCRNTRTDVSNCGMCGKACLLGGILGGCSNGGCL